MSTPASPSLPDFEDERSITPVSDFEAFRPSVSPQQWDATEGDGDQLWEVDEILGEETTINYKKKYQFKWAHWARADGTSTTWEHMLDGNDAQIKMWAKRAGKQRRKMAAESSDINLQQISSCMPHDIHTAENNEAYTEKLNKYKRTPFHAELDWYGEVEQLNRQRRERDNGKKRKRPEETEIKDRAREGARTLTELTAELPRLTRQPKRSSSSIQMMPESTSQPRPFVSKFEKPWNEAAQKAGSFPIRIVNTIDDEEPVTDDFVYLERGRIYAEGVPNPESFDDFLSGCDCKGRCTSKSLACSCQLDSQCSIDGKHARAYGSKGLFLFTDEGEVVECNKLCACDETCGNRVAQQPRLFEVEVFKTQTLGWAVRTKVDIPEGKVLGLYTGRVIKREAVERLSESALEYSFNLDLRDSDPELTDKYTISAYSAGNWTRFVNHSCEPTAKIYNVIFDTLRETNMPNIAYVACKAIPAGTEITIDYNPADTLAALLGKGKGRKSKGRTRCLCGTDSCRKWL